MNLVLFSLARVLTAPNGLSHAICQQANLLAGRGHAVSLVYTDREAEPFFPLHKAVRLYNLGLSYKRDLAVKLKAAFAGTLEEKHRIKYYGYGKKLSPRVADIIDKEKPDLIICYQIRAALIMKKLLSLPMPVLLSCHRSLDEIAADNQGLAVAEACDGLHVLTKGQAKGVQEKIGGARRVFAIGNAVLSHEKARPDYKSHRIISVGRVTPEKNHLLLIDAFQELAHEFPDWTLDIWGSTSESPSYYKTCRRRIQEGKLEGRIFFRGVTKSVTSELSGASIFAFPSPAEAFGMALLEAMSVGLPSVGLSTCTGVNELIEEGNGFLAKPDPKSFAHALRRLMEDGSLRERTGRKAKETAALYSPERIAGQWEKALAFLADPRGK